MEDQYFVRNGNDRWGPATLDQLRQWADEGKLRFYHEVENLATASTVVASQVPGLIFPDAGVYAAPPQETPTRDPNSYFRSRGSNKRIFEFIGYAKVFSLVSILAGFFGVWGMVFSVTGLACAFGAHYEVTRGHDQDAVRNMRMSFAISALGLAINVGLILFTAVKPGH